MENFGGLSGYHFCPEEPLEYLCAPNGSGKTTFAAFVCAMFYGLGSARTRKNLEEVPRKKYKPWQQGTWGGWIRFAAGTKQYRIERTFSEKEREDTFRYRNGITGLHGKYRGRTVWHDKSDVSGNSIYELESYAGRS